MALNKPNQELRRDLKAAAYSLEDAALENVQACKTARGYRTFRGNGGDRKTA